MELICKRQVVLRAWMYPDRSNPDCKMVRQLSHDRLSVVACSPPHQMVRVRKIQVGTAQVGTFSVIFTIKPFFMQIQDFTQF
jgi:hypothetical protein